MDRTELLLEHLHKTEMVGAEIGPFYAPIAPKRDGWKTIAIDYTSADELRRIARNHDASVIRDAEHKIEDVDIVWTGQPLDDLCLAIYPGGLDYLIASHVIEHSPNLVGLLRQASKMLKSTGRISLAVPDMRFCFDFFKSPTSTADLMLAHREQRTQHTPETMFMAHGYSAIVDGHGAWVAGNRSLPHLSANIEHAKAQYQRYLEGYLQGTQSYEDAHCWYFTPSSFQLNILELNYLGLIDFEIDELHLTPGAEFICQLVRSSVPKDVAVLHQRRIDLFHATIRELAIRVEQIG